MDYTLEKAAQEQPSLTHSLTQSTCISIVRISLTLLGRARIYMFTSPSVHPYIYIYAYAYAYASASIHEMGQSGKMGERDKNSSVRKE